MARLSYPILDAAYLAHHSYNPGASALLKPQILDTMRSAHDGGVQACLIRGNFLLVTGSNSTADYLRNNLRPLGLGKVKMSLKSKATTGDTAGQRWHQGFLAYAREVEGWLGNRTPRFIIGHSLGAAATQILSRRYNVPAIAFASPRVVTPNAPLAQFRLCLNICRTDDPVCYVPPSMRHIGADLWISGVKKERLMNHKMIRYIELLKKAKPGQLPTKWPLA